jgi:sigma-B regulation protein RsbU (phosphoserine phosphatase)
MCPAWTPSLSPVRDMFKNKGIAFKLVLFFTLSSAAIFAAIFSYNYVVSRRMIQKGIEENSAYLITTTTSRIEVLLTSTQKVPQNTADLPRTRITMRPSF